MEKLYTITYPNDSWTFHPERYTDVLASMKMFSDFTYLTSEDENKSPYHRVKKNYFFGNPCRYNPKILDNIGIDINTCETIIDGAFTRGLASYMRASSSLADAYING